MGVWVGEAMKRKNKRPSKFCRYQLQTVLGELWRGGQNVSRGAHLFSTQDTKAGGSL